MKNLQLKVMNRYILFLIISLCIYNTANAQHYVGVKDAYGIMGLSSTPSLRSKSINTTLNPGLVYRYEHKKNFAIQTELNLINKGYKFVDTATITTPRPDSTIHISSFEIPLLAQVFVRWGWFRPYITGGAFAGFITKRQKQIGDGSKKDFDKNGYERTFEYGIIGGAGMAFTVSRFELQAEWRYQYAFSFLQDPHINGQSLYMNPTQMMISLTLFYRLGK